MDQQQASAWRIQLARDLMPYYSNQDDIKMIVLGGSPSLGLSDAYSDLDIIVYWDRIDHKWIEQVPLKVIGGEHTMFRQLGDDVYLESYYFETLKVDFGHTTLEMWQKWTSQVFDELDPDPGLQKSISGFLDSIPLLGEELVNEWKQKLSYYPEGLALKIVKQNLGFFVKGCLLNQGLNRGDILYYYDGTCWMLKKLLNILAALNGKFFSTAEPRWIEYELSTMEIKPENMWHRINDIFLQPGPGAMTILYQLIDEVLKLVEQHLPDLDLSRVRKGISLEVRACPIKPEIPGLTLFSDQ